MKGVILPNPSTGNKFSIMVAGLPLLTATTMGKLEDELKKFDLPDNTTASGGESKPTELEFTIPLHHKLEMLAMEAWYAESHDPVLPSYKKEAVITYYTMAGDVPAAVYLASGVYPSKRGLPEQDMSKEGELGVCTWTLSIDSAVPTF